MQDTNATLLFYLFLWIRTSSWDAWGSETKLPNLPTMTVFTICFTSWQSNAILETMSWLIARQCWLAQRQFAFILVQMLTPRGERQSGEGEVGANAPHLKQNSATSTSIFAVLSDSYKWSLTTMWFHKGWLFFCFKNCHKTQHSEDATAQTNIITKTSGPKKNGSARVPTIAWRSHANLGQRHVKRCARKGFNGLGNNLVASTKVEQEPQVRGRVGRDNASKTQG